MEEARRPKPGETLFPPNITWNVIKTLGTTIVPVKLHKDVTAELTVKVTEL